MGLVPPNQQPVAKRSAAKQSQYVQIRPPPATNIASTNLGSVGSCTSSTQELTGLRGGGATRWGVFLHARHPSTQVRPEKTEIGGVEEGDEEEEEEEEEDGHGIVIQNLDIPQVVYSHTLLTTQRPTEEFLECPRT